MPLGGSASRPSICWLWGIGCLIAVPLLPEYVAPILSAVALALAYRDAKTAGRPLKTGVLGRYIVGYLAFLLIGVLYSQHRLSSLSIFLMWLTMAGVYVAFVNLTASPERLQTALRCLSLAVGVMGLIACIEYAVNLWIGPVIPLQFWNPLDRWVYSAFPVPIRLDSAGLRVGSTFSNPNMFAETMVMLAPFSLFGCATETSKRGQTYHAVCLVLAGIGTFFSFSRGSYLAMCAILLAFILLNLNRVLHRRAVFISVLIGIMLLLSFLTIIPNALSDRLSTLSFEDVSVRERLRIWETVLHLDICALLFGIGAGTAGTTELLQHAGIAGVPHMHNLFLQLLIEGGVIALTLIAMLLGSMVLSQARLRQSSKAGYLFCSTFLAMLCGFALMAMVEFPFLSPKLVGIFLLTAALCDTSCHLYGGEDLLPFVHLFPLASLWKREKKTS